MSPLIKIAITVVVVAVVTALLSPPVYWLIHDVVAKIFPWLETVPFHRVFGRVLLVCVLLAIGPLLIILKISNFRELGLKRNDHRGRDFIWGLVAGLLPVVLLMTAYVYFHVCRLRGDEVEFVSILRIIGTAFSVSILEEVFFRGLLYGLSRRVLGPLSSAAWTSIVFAIVHFMRSSGSDRLPVDAWSGFREFGYLFGSIPPVPIFLFGLVALFLVGWLLCWCVEQTHSLVLSIGLHVGWVLGIQGFNLFTKFRIKSTEILPWVAPNVVSGTVPVGIFAILAIFLTFLISWTYLHGFSRKTAPARCS